MAKETKITPKPTTTPVTRIITEDKKHVPRNDSVEKGIGFIITNKQPQPPNPPKPK
ncbi:MAG: hypothetical protein ACOYBQ_09950 [Fluviibacter sp.]